MSHRERPQPETDDMHVSAWLIEHGDQLPPVLVAEYPTADDAWMLFPVLHAHGFTPTTAIGRRLPPGLPGWNATADFTGTAAQLRITTSDGILFYTGQLGTVPPRWRYAATEQRWCVLYTGPVILDDNASTADNLAQLTRAAAAGQLLAARIRVTVQER